VDVNSRGAGLAAVVATTVVFSWGFIIVKAVQLPAGALAFWRLLIGAGVLVVAAAVLRTPWPRRWGAVAAAGLAFGAHQLVFIAATQTTTIAVVTLLGAVQPLLVSLVSHRTVGERVPRRVLWCSVLAVVGVGVVVQANLGAASRSLLGDLLSVLNVLLFTAYFLSAKKARDDGVPALTMTAGFLLVSLVVVAPALLLGGAVLPTTAGDWWLLALLALVPGNGHLLLNWAHPRVTAALSSLVLASLPLLSSIWASLVFGEPYGPRHVVGMLLVVLAIELGRRTERERQPAIG
jgi:drug/metabolite transporter (DMT)-like permease